MTIISYTIRDAEHHARLFPTFLIPPLETRLKFQVEDVVQLMFETHVSDNTRVPCERMWVEVVTVLAPGEYIGHLDNHPIFIKGVQYGDPIKFEARHVIKYINEDGQPDI